MPVAVTLFGSLPLGQTEAAKGSLLCSRVAAGREMFMSKTISRSLTAGLWKSLTRRYCGRGAKAGLPVRSTGLVE